MTPKIYDAIVIGTGAAGSIIAKELVAKNKDVLIIEQGNVPRRIGQLKHALNFYNFSKVFKLPQKTIEGIIVFATLTI